jgi:hypothetical protein
MLVITEASVSPHIAFRRTVQTERQEGAPFENNDR